MNGDIAMGNNTDKLESLRRLLQQPGMDRRGFVLRAIELGVSVAVAYTLLGEAGKASAAAEELDRKLEANPSGRFVSSKQSALEQQPMSVEGRVERLRSRAAAERASSGRSPMQVAQEDFTNFENFDNWDNG